MCVLNWASYILCVQNLKALFWCPAQTSCRRMVQPSCSCWGGWLTMHRWPPSLENCPLLMELPTLPTRLSTAFRQWWTNVGRQRPCKGPVCLKGGTAPRQGLCSRGLLTTLSTGIRSELDLTWSHTSAWFLSPSSILLHPILTGLPWEHALMFPHTPESLPQALLLGNLTLYV